MTLVSENAAHNSLQMLSSLVGEDAAHNSLQMSSRDLTDVTKDDGEDDDKC